MAAAAANCDISLAYVDVSRPALWIDDCLQALWTEGNANDVVYVVSFVYLIGAFR